MRLFLISTAAHTHTLTPTPTAHSTPIPIHTNTAARTHTPEIDHDGSELGQELLVKHARLHLAADGGARYVGELRVGWRVREQEIDREIDI